MVDDLPLPYRSLVDWIAGEAVAFDPASMKSLNAAVDGVMGKLGTSIELLALGEPTHGIEAFLTFRNCVFQRLVAAHGVTAIALESSFPRGPIVNEYIAGRGGNSLEEVLEAGFSHGFGQLAT